MLNFFACEHSKIEKIDSLYLRRGLGRGCTLRLKDHFSPTSTRMVQIAKVDFRFRASRVRNVDQGPERVTSPSPSPKIRRGDRKCLCANVFAHPSLESILGLIVAAEPSRYPLPHSLVGEGRVRVPVRFNNHTPPSLRASGTGIRHC